VRAQARAAGFAGDQAAAAGAGRLDRGMQALDWAILHPERVERAVIIGVAPVPAMGLALNHLQRQAIENDPEWQGGGAICRSGPRDAVWRWQGRLRCSATSRRAV